MRGRALTLFVLLTLSVAAMSQTPAAIERILLSRLAGIEKWSNYGMTPDEAKLQKENSVFKKDLLRYGKLPATLTYGFPRLRKELQIVTSRDARLRIYSWDRQSGGTMQDFDSVYQYRGNAGKIRSWSESGPDEDTSGAFYHDIFQLDTRLGPIYLAVSTFIASGTFRSESIDIIRIDGDQIVRDSKLFRTGSGLQNSISFEYDFSSVVDRRGRPIKLFRFDEATRSFSFPVVIQDEETPQGRVTNRRITYRFDGKYFDQVR